MKTRPRVPSLACGAGAPRFAARHPLATAALVLTPCLALALSGCGSDDDKKPITGTRVSVLQLDRKIEPDLALKGRPVLLPPAATSTAAKPHHSRVVGWSPNVLPHRANSAAKAATAMAVFRNEVRVMWGCSSRG